MNFQKLSVCNIVNKSGSNDKHFFAKHLDLNEQQGMSTHTVSQVTCDIDTFSLKGMIIMTSQGNGLLVSQKITLARSITCR